MAAISYEAVGCVDPVAAADAVELAFEVDAANADAAKFAAAVATLGYSAGAYQSTVPPAVAALAPEPAPSLALTLALALAADVADADADAAVAAEVSLAAAAVDPPALASSRARVRSSAIFLRSASSSY